MEEEGVSLRGSSELSGLSGDISSPYGRNGYTGLVTEDEKEQEEEALKPGPNVSHLHTKKLPAYQKFIRKSCNLFCR